MGNQIHLACWRDDCEILEKLRGNITPDDFKRPDVFGASPFHVAVFQGSVKCLEIILDKQIYGDLSHTFGGGVTAFDLAKATHRMKIYSDLLVHQDTHRAINIFKLDIQSSTLDVEYDACVAVEAKAKKGGILEYILPGGDINASLVEGPTHLTPLFFSAVLNDLESVKTLLAQEAVIKDTALSPKNLLCLATRFGYYQLIPVLIDAGFSISHEPGAYTPLVIAAQYGSLPCVKAITTRKEYDPTTAGADRALFMAAQYGQFHIISTLVKAGATVNNMYYEGKWRIPLNAAAAHDHRTTVEKLLEFDADPFCPNKDSDTCTCTALTRAAYFESCSVLKPLINAGLSPTASCKDPSHKHMSPTVIANLSGSHHFLKAMIDCGYDPDSLGCQGRNPLEYAIEHRYFQRKNNLRITHSAKYLEELINIGCKVNRLCENTSLRGLGAIHLAAQYNDVAALRVLLKNGVGTYFDSQLEEHITPVHVAAMHNSSGALEVLVKAGANVDIVDPDGNPPLHLAYHYQAMESLKKLLQLGANPDSRNVIGVTLLNIAASNDRVDIIELLACNGADLSTVVPVAKLTVPASADATSMAQCIPAHQSLTPLHSAVLFRARNAVKKLIELGASINAKADDRTPLLDAALENFAEIVSDLLTSGASIEKSKVDIKLRVSVLKPIISGHTDVVRILSETGCDISLPSLQMDKTSPDLNPFQAASLFCRPEILRILYEGTKNINVNQYSYDHLSPLHLALLQATVIDLLPHGPVPRLPMDCGTDDYLMNEELTVKYLIDVGCNVNATDEKGVTPLDLAVHYKLKNIISILVTAGGERGDKIKDRDELRKHIEELEKWHFIMSQKMKAMESQMKDLQDTKVHSTQQNEAFCDINSSTMQQMGDMQDSMRKFNVMLMDSSAETNPIAILLNQFLDSFMKDAGAKEVASELRRRKVIPEHVETKIERALDRKAANGFLYDHLYAQGTFQTLEIVCDVFIGEQGYPRMNQLGERIKKELIHRRYTRTT